MRAQGRTQPPAWCSPTPGPRNGPHGFRWLGKMQGGSCFMPWKSWEMQMWGLQAQLCGSPAVPFRFCCSDGGCKLPQSCSAGAGASVEPAVLTSVQPTPEDRWGFPQRGHGGLLGGGAFGAESRSTSVSVPGGQKTRVCKGTEIEKGQGCAQSRGHPGGMGHRPRSRGSRGLGVFRTLKVERP